MRIPLLRATAITAATLLVSSVFAETKFVPNSIKYRDTSAPPYGNTRRLITDFDVNKDAKRAHSSVVPGSAAAKDAAGKFRHEEVWRYLFTHPVEQTGTPVPLDPECGKRAK